MISSVSFKPAPQTFAATPPPTVAATSPPPSGADRLTFSGAAMDAIKKAVLMPQILEKETAFRALLNTDVLEGVSGLTVLRACMEDIAANKDGDGDVRTSDFLKRVGLESTDAQSKAIESFLAQASQLGLLYRHSTTYIRATALGELVARDSDIEQRLQPEKPEAQKGLL